MQRRGEVVTEKEEVKGSRMIKRERHTKSRENMLNRRRFNSKVVIVFILYENQKT